MVLRRLSNILLAGVLTALSHPAFGQVSQDLGRAPFPTSDQLMAAAGGDSAAAAVVSAAVSGFLRSRPQSTITIIAEQIPAEWLPAIPGVEWVRLSDGAARTHAQQCGTFMFVSSFRRPTPDVAVVTVEQGNKCQSIGRNFHFRLTASGWAADDGVVGGVVGGRTDCGCP